MKTYRTSFFERAAFLLLLCSVFTFSRTATACPFLFSGPTSFTATPGGSQSQTWIVYSGGDPEMTVNITAGSDVFTVSQMPVMFSLPSVDSATFTITFNPGANATGIFNGTLTCPCGKTYELIGSVVAASGVANALPTNVSFTISPNPATDNINILSSGVRTSEIGIYNLLGKEITSSKTTNWQCDVSSIATGAYIVRIVGESFSGDQFIISRRIIIAR